jgi:hypothetical protein
MSKFLYSQSVPENNKSAYTSYDTVDFVLTGEGALMANSVRLEGSLKVLFAGTQSTNADATTFNPRTGAHSFIDSITTSTSLGQIETHDNYARLVAMEEAATKDRNDTLDAESVCELKSPSVQYSKDYCNAMTTNNGGTSEIDLYDFSIKPQICLNKMVGGNLDFDKVKYIKVSISLARAAECLYGISTSNATYELSDLKLVYNEVDASGDDVSMRTIIGLKQSLNSAFSNISTKVPAVCDAVSCSVIKQVHEANQIYDNQRLENIDDLESVSFLFNNSSNQYVTYSIRDKGELIGRFINSLGDTGRNDVSAERFKSNDSFGLGISFGEFVDLTNQKFNIQIKTGSNGINNANQFSIFMYFHSVIKV